MLETFKRQVSPNKQFSSQSFKSFRRKIFAGSASLLVAFSAASAVASAATPAAAGIKLKQQAPLLLRTNDGDHNCFSYYSLQNNGYYNEPTANFTITATMDGNYSMVYDGWLIFSQDVNYKSRYVITETANNPNDYFVKDGKHVKSVSFVRTGPTSVPNPAYCLDKPPVAGSFYAERTTLDLTPVVYDVIASASDPDNASTSLTLSNVHIISGTASVSVVTLANGHKAVKLTPTAGYPRNYYDYMRADFTLTDPLGKSSVGNVALRYKL